MDQQPLSPADSIANAHWEAIAQIISSDPNNALVSHQMAFARAVWLKAFEAGHAKGLEALSSAPGKSCPEDLMAALEGALVDRRSAFLLAEATHWIKKMLPRLQTQATAFVENTTQENSAAQRKRPDLKIVSPREKTS